MGQKTWDKQTTNTWDKQQNKTWDEQQNITNAWDKQQTCWTSSSQTTTWVKQQNQTAATSGPQGFYRVLKCFVDPSGASWDPAKTRCEMKTLSFNGCKKALELIRNGMIFDFLFPAKTQDLKKTKPLKARFSRKIAWIKLKIAWI